jgi:2-succinyl-5-enolpyruvyl-6-hydroxy-3-cyclohexene-1-carboxylate synthase
MTHNLAISQILIEKLIQLGSDHFVVSPGSRSTPLTVAIARNPSAQTIVHFDERGAAFFALGFAKATEKPAVLICTSGTAVANYFPAVVEASMDNIPLIILSADRPPELIDVGANQAIFQDNIYGKYPRLFKNLDPPNTETSPEQVLADIEDAYAAATGSRPGPVHVNCQFREPLLPESNHNIKFSESTEIRDPSLPLRKTLSKNSPEQLSQIAKNVLSSQQGLIVVGRSVDSQHNDAILKLAEKLSWPVLPDIQSKLRFKNHKHIINHFDLVLLKEDLLSRKPDMVIHLGGAFTSKRLLNYLNNPDIYYVSVKETPERIDPNHQVDVVVQLNVSEFCSSLYLGLREHFDRLSMTPQPPESEWLSKWKGADKSVSDTIESLLDEKVELNEPGISYHLSNMIPKAHSLMLANSMPIREMEMFAQSNEFDGRIIANRGSSGIDGLIATAVGHVTGSNMPLTLLVGDLAALHDLNSLALIKTSPQPIIMILINNNGGGIFNFLPVQSETDVFESFFGTPHGWTFEKAAAMFDLDYVTPKDLNDLQQYYSKATEQSKSTIIEIRTDRYENYNFHKMIFKAIREA